MSVRAWIGEKEADFVWFRRNHVPIKAWYICPGRGDMITVAVVQSLLNV
jgi:hypothetical protein